jgi:hypothetical protein
MPHLALTGCFFIYRKRPLIVDITPDIVTDFRAASAFTDATKWSDETITQVLEEADAETGGRGWGVFIVGEGQNFKRRGMYLFASHLIVSTMPKGGSVISGSSKFAVSSKSVGDESTTYNNGNLANANVGDSWLASSGFGQQFLRLRQRAGRAARTG